MRNGLALSLALQLPAETHNPKSATFLSIPLSHRTHSLATSHYINTLWWKLFHNWLKKLVTDSVGSHQQLGKKMKEKKKKHDWRISSGTSSKFWPGFLVSSSSFVCECFCSSFWSYKYVYHPPPANEARGKHTATEPHSPDIHPSLLFLWASFSWRSIHMPTLGDIL